MGVSARPDVVVIGGGVIGLAVARELARRRWSVVVIERGSPAREASWAAAGMLSPLGEASGMPGLHALADTSLDLWPGFAGALLEETGIDVEYRQGGAIHVAFDDGERAALDALAGRAGPGASLLDRAELETRVAGLADEIICGLHLDRDHRVDNRRLGQALWSAAVGVDVEFRLGAAATRVDSAGDAIGVQLKSGERIEAGACVLAAGAWSGALEGLPGPLPVRPIRGQMFALAPADPRLPAVLVSSGCYIVPRDDGRILVGATVEDVGFRPGPTPDGIGGLFDAAGRVVPHLLDRPLVETWAGFRPGTPDGRPILGPDPDLAGLFHATGHFRNGILLAPVTARVIADAAEGDAAGLAAFSAARFR